MFVGMRDLSNDADDVAILPDAAAISSSVRMNLR